MNFDQYEQFERLGKAQLPEPISDSEAILPLAGRVEEERLAREQPAYVTRDGVRVFGTVIVPGNAYAGSIFDHEEPGYDPRHIRIMLTLILLGYAFYIPILLWYVILHQYTLDRIFPQAGYALGIGLGFAKLGYYVTAGVLLYMNRSWGWYLSVVMAVCIIVIRLLLIIRSGSEHVAMVSPTSPVQFLSLGVTSGILYLLMTPALRETFRIPRNGVRHAVGWSVLAGLGVALLTA